MRLFVRWHVGLGWLVSAAGGGGFGYATPNGRLFSHLSIRNARVTYGDDPKHLGLACFTADPAPPDRRRPVASCQVRFADRTNLDSEDATGQVLPGRSRFGRVVDFRQGLHLVPLDTREDRHHPLLILCRAFAAGGALLGRRLLLRRRRARVRA